MHINLLFPTPIFETVDEEDTCNRADLYAACQAVVKQPHVKNRVKNDFQRVDTSHIVDDELHLREEFAPLAAFIDRAAQPFLKSLGFPSWRLETYQMWTNVGKKGDFVYPHSHAGEAFVSGVYYVQCDKRDGLTFHHSLDRTPPETFNDLNATTYYFEGLEGRMLMFRSETLHSTFPQKADERVIVSFNLRLKPPA